MSDSLAIVVIATNKYFPLAIRFINNWSHFYYGDDNYKIILFSDKDPYEYIPTAMTERVDYVHTTHTKIAMDMFSKKFLSLRYALDQGYDNVFYFDADTSIKKHFSRKDFVSTFSIVRHAANDYETNINDLPFDRTANSMACLDPSTIVGPVTYYHACVFGGDREHISNLIFVCMSWVFDDKLRAVTPRWHDESYINKYINSVVNRVSIQIPWNSEIFNISDKGASYDNLGPGESPVDRLQPWGSVKELISNNKEKLITIDNGVYRFE